MGSERKSKNAGVELARIIACLCVICIHIGIVNRDEQGYIAHGLLISCFVADGVSVFWIITGLFLMNSDYLRLIRRTLKRIFFPMMMCCIFCFCFADALISGGSFGLLQYIIRPWADYKYQIRNFFELNAVVPYCGQFWYLYIYFLLVLCFPVMKSFIGYLDQSSKRIKIFLIVTGIIFLWNDLTANAFLTFTHHSVNALVPAMVATCLGHYIYKFRDILIRKQLPAVYLAVFIIVNICRAYVVSKSDGFETSYYILLYWFTLYGIICASCIVLGCMSLMDSVSCKNRMTRLVNMIGGNTFGIFLVHFFVMELIKSWDVYQLIVRFSGRIQLRWIGDLCYLGIMAVSVFIVSLVIVACIRKMGTLFVALVGLSVRAAGRK